MATIARFQGGHFNGYDMQLPASRPLQRNIYLTQPPPIQPPEYAPLATIAAPVTLTYSAISSGYAGENYIIIYRLEE